MSHSLVLVLLITLGFVGGGVLSRLTRGRLKLGGAEYFLIGALLGPSTGSIFLSQEHLETYKPLFYLFLGLVGFLAGLKNSQLRFVKKIYINIISAYVFILLLSFSLFFLYFLVYHTLEQGFWHKVSFFESSSPTLWLLSCFGIILCLTSPYLLLTYTRNLNLFGFKLQRWIRIIESTESLSIFSFGILLCVYKSYQESFLVFLYWFLGSIVIGLFISILYRIFVGYETTPHRIYIATMSLLIFLSGIGAVLGLSPIFLGVISGTIFCFLSKDSLRIENELYHIQEPLFNLCYLFAGALWGIPPLWCLALLIFCVFIQILFQEVFGYFLRSILSIHPKLFRQEKYLFIGQGAFSIAIAINYAMIFPDEKNMILSIVPAIIFINLIYGKFITLKFLHDCYLVGILKEKRKL